MRNAGLGKPGTAAAAARQPVGPPQIQLFPGNGNPSSRPRWPTNKRVRGWKSQVTVKQFTIQLTEATLQRGWDGGEGVGEGGGYIWKGKSLNWERIFYFFFVENNPSNRNLPESD